MLSDKRRTLPAGTWHDVQRDFRWAIPEHFNIAQACCDDWAALDPNRPAIIHVTPDGDTQVWTFGTLKDASDRLASAFQEWGLQKGDRVAVLLSQSPEVMVAHFATMKLGAIVLPLFTLFGDDALDYRLADSGAKIAVTDDANLEKLVAVGDRIASLEAIVNVGNTGRGVPKLCDVLASARPLPSPVVTCAEDPAMLIYTSGTTGDPKGALHAHRFLFGHLPSVEMHLERFPQSGDVAWTPADWAWIGGLMDLAMPALYFGVPLVSCRMRKFDPDRAFTLMHDQRISALFLPPTALKLLQQTRVPEGLSVRAIGSGGESLSSDLLDWGREHLSAPINELYGQTECNLVVSSSAGLGVLRPGTMGQAVPGHRVAILDEKGAHLPHGSLGEIAVARPDPVMFLGYWNTPEKTHAKFHGDWMRTGDLGAMDADGYVTYASRDDDVITSAGYRIGPTEIENCMTGDPDVVMAAAVGLLDPERTEAVTAFVVLRKGAARSGVRDRLIDRVRTRVSPHVAPRRVVVVDKLPMTATGKIMRRVLRESPPD